MRASMPLPAGTRLGPYEVVSALGAGGMGEVYKARDTRLDRIVAVKILPSALAADAALRDRFEREARSLSGLSHPNICTVFDVGHDGGVDYLVMEHLEGQTLASVLTRGPMTPADALRVADQIADALVVAHRAGIIHRDLKPANVMIARGRSGPGTVKLLDFGLAKRAAEASAVAGMTATHDATRAAPLTGAGTILGTFPYMAPEQIEGRDADARADIWAFGCVLYEMLAGRRAFDAASQASLIAAILERQPPPIRLPDAALSPAINRLIAACLEKDPDDRFQSMRDVRRELEWISAAGPISSTGSPGPRPTRPGIIAAVGAVSVVAAVATTAWLMRGTPELRQPAFFTISLGSRGFTAGPAGIFGGAGSGAPEVSPDGRRIMFVAHNAVENLLWVRDLSKLEAQPLGGTSGARGGFWSPDGRLIGFFGSGKLKTIDPATGRVDVVCDAPLGFGGTWAADGTILFSPDERAPIYKVNARGGTPVQVTKLAPGEEAHRWPRFLPDGRHFLYMPWADGSTTRAVMLGSLDGGPAKRLLDSQSAAALAGDYLLYVVDNPARLMAQGLDTERLELRGAPFPLVADENVDYQWVTGEPNASAAATTLVYTTGKYRRSQLTWVDRTGRTVGTLGDPTVQFDPVISPDGSSVALERTDPGRGTGDIWTIDLARGAFSRLTSAPGYESTPVWSPDGRIAYASDQARTAQLYVMNANGAGSESVLVTPRARSFALDWSPDGRYVLFMLNGGASRNDIWMYDVARKSATPLLESPFNEGWARISPDGKWIAYTSAETGQLEVYVRSFPGGDVKVEISTGGGNQPQWRRDARELFYIAPDNTVFSVDVRATNGRFEASKPQALFTAHVDQNKTIRNQYAVAPDGQRFLTLSLVDPNDSPIVAVLNWRGLLRQ
jgi:serine/threonine protein kinase/Tol biopolymer transport system component